MVPRNDETLPFVEVERRNRVIGGYHGVGVHAIAAGDAVSGLARTRPVHASSRRDQRRRPTVPSPRAGSGAAPIAASVRGPVAVRHSDGCSRTSYEAHEAISSSARAPTTRPTHARAAERPFMRELCSRAGLAAIVTGSCRWPHRRAGSAISGTKRIGPRSSVSSPAWSRRTRTAAGRRRHRRSAPPSRRRSRVGRRAPAARRWRRR